MFKGYNLLEVENKVNKNKIRNSDQIQTKKDQP